MGFVNPGFGQSVLLQLRNGDRVSGTVVAEDGAQITLSNSVLGRVNVPLAQVERRSTNVTVAVLPPGPVTTNVVGSLTPALSPVDQKRLNDLQAAYLANQMSSSEYFRQRSRLLAQAAEAIAKADAPVVKPTGVPAPALVNPAVVPKPSTASPPPLKPAAPRPWTGEALLGADLVYSEKDRQLYSARLKFIYAKRPLRSSFDYLATYGRTDGELSANRMDGSLKTDYDLNPKVYVFGLFGGGYDELRKVDWRYEVSPGVGRHLLRLTNMVLNAEVGASYQVQNFEGNRQDDVFHYRLAQDFKWNIGTQFTFDEKVEYLPQWNEPKEFKLRVEGNLRYWLRANLSLNLTVINIFDTITARGVSQNDLQVKSSIGVKF